MKTSELIKRLQLIKQKTGDNEVFLSGDSEGNYYGTIGDTSFGADNKKLILYPHHEGIDYSELPLTDSEKGEI